MLPTRSERRPDPGPMTCTAYCSSRTTPRPAACCTIPRVRPSRSSISCRLQTPVRHCRRSMRGPQTYLRSLRIRGCAAGVGENRCHTGSHGSRGTRHAVAHGLDPSIESRRSFSRAAGELPVSALQAERLTGHPQARCAVGDYQLVTAPQRQPARLY